MSYSYKKTSNIDYMFRVFNALGQISFAYAGHAVVLEIQATIPSTPEKPSKVPMWKGAVWAYFINAICYFPVAFIGYWAFGNDVTDNVLVALERPAWLIAAANLMVVVLVIGSYQVLYNVSETSFIASRFKHMFCPSKSVKFLVEYYIEKCLLSTYRRFMQCLSLTFWREQW